MKRRSFLQSIVGFLFAPKLLKTKNKTIYIANGIDSVQEWKEPTNQYEALEETRQFLDKIICQLTLHKRHGYSTDLIVVNDFGDELIRYSRNRYWDGSIPIKKLYRYVLLENITTEYSVSFRPDLYLFSIPIIVGKGFKGNKPQFFIPQFSIE